MKKSFLKWGLICVVALVVVAGAGMAWMASKLQPAVAVGSVLPTAQLTTLDGDAFDVKAHDDQLVLLDFWTST